MARRKGTGWGGDEARRERTHWELEWRKYGVKAITSSVCKNCSNGPIPFKEAPSPMPTGCHSCPTSSGFLVVGVQEDPTGIRGTEEPSELIKAPSGSSGFPEKTIITQPLIEPINIAGG